MSEFISADITKIADFQKKSPEVIQEFDDIKTEFKRINEELLNAWEGGGANAYKTETDHILENVGSVRDVLNTINESAVTAIRTTYSDFDDEMGAYNGSLGGEE